MMGFGGIQGTGFLRCGITQAGCAVLDMLQAMTESTGSGTSWMWFLEQT